MLRDEDEFDPEYPCPVCHRSFGSYAALDDHLPKHEGPRQCHQCGESIKGPYHRCR
jgi:C2H2-type zinc finger